MSISRKCPNGSGEIEGHNTAASGYLANSLLRLGRVLAKYDNLFTADVASTGGSIFIQRTSCFPSARRSARRLVASVCPSIGGGNLPTTTTGYIFLLCLGGLIPRQKGAGSFLHQSRLRDSPAYSPVRVYGPDIWCGYGIQQVTRRGVNLPDGGYCNIRNR